MSETIQILPFYTFIPQLRRGVIATQIDQIDYRGQNIPTDGNGRATIAVNARIKGDGKSQDPPVTKSISLIGPGDIIGLDPRAVSKMEPPDRSSGFEPHYLPYVEFFDEDLPWRYTPAKVTNSGLTPWLTLLVLSGEEFERKHEPERYHLPAIEVQGLPAEKESDTPGYQSRLFPPFEQLWAWAHVQINADIDLEDSGSLPDARNRLEELLNANPAIASSRLVCPRKLKADTAYHAFLIPSYEVGRLAGLKQPSDSIPFQTPSWGTPTFSGTAVNIHTHEPNVWPYYHSWSFHTGQREDFESLVRKIIPRELDQRVGKRPMDIQNSTWELDYTGDDGTLFLEGALKVPDEQLLGEGTDSWWDNPDAGHAQEADDYRKRLRDLVNLAEELKQNMPADINNLYQEVLMGTVGDTDDPIITPPIYGFRHALKNHLEEDVSGRGDWLQELNLDPRLRAIAGIGVSVLQKNQEAYMDKAWEQIGEVIAANRKIDWIQFAREVNEALYNRHIANQPAETVLQITASLHKQVMMTGGKTAYSAVGSSALPNGATTNAFRKMQRPHRTAVKKLDPSGTLFRSSFIRKLGDTADELNPAPPLPPPERLFEFLDDGTTIDDFNTQLKATANAPVASQKKASSETSSLTEQDALDMQQSLQAYEGVFAASNWPTETPADSLDVDQTAAEVMTRIHPNQVMLQQYQQQFEFNLPVPDTIVPIIHAPVIDDPMYQAIVDLSPELLIPRLDLVPQNTISLLESNPKFVEAFMVGLNHEMSRELRWREYPTDMRGSYFRQFWSANDALDQDGNSPSGEAAYDIFPIHTWVSGAALTDLGKNNSLVSKGSDGEDGKLVLIIRGDLLRKFPTTVIYAVPANWQPKEDQEDSFDYSRRRLPDMGKPLFPKFTAKIEPDVFFLGFDITAGEAKGDEPDVTVTDNSLKPGYFFVLQERPGENRFGMDISGQEFNNWNDLHWKLFPEEMVNIDLNSALPTDPEEDGFDNNIPAQVDIDANEDLENVPQYAIQWNEDSAQMAMLLYQNPVLVAIHTQEMIP